MAHPRSPSDPVTDPRRDEHRPTHDPADLLAGLSPPMPLTAAERLDHLRQRLSRSPARSVGLALTLMVLAVIAWWLVRPPPAPIESTLPLASASPTDPAGPAGVERPGGSGGTATTTVPEEMVVQASGAVVRPGVYRLAPDARVDDVVRQAGGLAPDADADRVNLAAPVADGERLWVPRKGETEPPEVVAGTGAGTGGSAVPGAGEPGAAGTGQAKVVDLNAADAVELETLPGVGPATATAILAYRDEHGSFSSVDELVEVRGIGDAKLEQLRPLVAV